MRASPRRNQALPNQQNKQKSKAVKTSQKQRSALTQRVLTATTMLQSAGGQRRQYGDFLLYRLSDPFPPRYRSKLIFEFQENIVSSGTPLVFGSIGHIIYLNGGFSPTAAATHQPYGWDQLAALYNRYKITRAKIAIACDFTSLTAANAWLGVQLQPTNSVITLAANNVSAASEQPMTVVKKMEADTLHVEVICEVPIWAVEGVTKTQFDADNSLFEAAVTANPTLTPFINYAIAANAALTATATIRCEYDCEHFQRNTLGQS